MDFMSRFLVALPTPQDLSTSKETTVRIPISDSIGNAVLRICSEVHMKTVLNVFVVVVLLAMFAFCQSDDQKKEQNGTEQDRIKESGEVLKQILDMPDKGIPASVLNGSKCVIVLPSVKKVAIGIGGTYGRGTMSCRTRGRLKGPWSAPIMMASSGGNIGFQIGGEATDFVILVMNDQGAKAMLKNKVKLGADASVAAGPVGRTAEASTNAENGRSDAFVFTFAASSAEYLFLAPRSALTVMPMRNCTERRSVQRRSSPARFQCRRRHSSLFQSCRSRRTCPHRNKNDADLSEKAMTLVRIP